MWDQQGNMDEVQFDVALTKLGKFRANGDLGYYKLI